MKKQRITTTQMIKLGIFLFYCIITAQIFILSIEKNSVVGGMAGLWIGYFAVKQWEALK